MKKAEIKLNGNTLSIITPSGEKRDFAFPAAAISVNGKYIQAKHQQGKALKTENGGYEVRFVEKDFSFRIIVEPGGPDWIFKQVIITTDKEMPTADFVEVDSQMQYVPGLKRCGYMITDGRKVSPTAEEEGAGVTPGCGYPLIGDDFFTGLEHPAAFNLITEQKGKKTGWSLRHFPIWEDKTIQSVRAVIGVSETPRKSFMEYLSTIRIPMLKKFLISFCSFWSDPYLGNYEYKVDKNNYVSLVNAFKKLGLRPDVYTLDAGWHDRNSIFTAKKMFGGNQALKKIAEEFRQNGSNLSVWVSHNGPMGIAPEYMKAQGISVGSGQSSSYSGDNYGVMMDQKLEKALTERFCELISPEYGAIHFKMDWENDCATTPDFQEKYPTRDHVREASINMMSRVADAMRKTNPQVMTRNGWWPSPWWLTRTNHTFLTDSGDSEYACFPSLSQRDAAATQRDSMYYAQQRRDLSAYPLDAYDNHEFAHALRNPFVETPAVWSNTCLWTFMRGASYIPLTIQPESLEKWQAEKLRDVFKFARKHAGRILTGNSAMIGGAPSFGEVYGFLHTAKNGKILLALRNPAPIPQKYQLPSNAPYWLQCYPHYQNFHSGESIFLAPHEVKILDGTEEQVLLPAEKFQIRKSNKNELMFSLPASECPGVAEIYQIPELEQIFMEAHPEENSFGYGFGIKSPYKMRNFKLYFKLKGKNCDKVNSIRLYCSRNNGWRVYSCWQVSYQEHFFNYPGAGEGKNPDLQPQKNVRYFSAEIPQGGQCYFNLIFAGTKLTAEDIELFASGYEAPAEKILKTTPVSELLAIPQHPDGFPLTIQLV